ncbi:dual 3',5'-cyclic-AMP and -GMP phosphodiesterase beta-like isoform X2 [Hylaeus volcanicus]|nr:dual 3',5'-cyclic-AMP and -GMP phosphodiesterase beta-like isoform X2 [Hylaeus volcanicus]XP_053992303.1 dual 3',5'-cyclic-AMP and -GMP phosphodiesterase beta-like isoform X2 [Hylaeus volcanicus]
MYILILIKNGFAKYFLKETRMFSWTFFILINLVTIAIFFLLLYIGQWFTEVEKRLHYLHLMKCNSERKVIQNTTAKRKGRKGTTVVEDITTLVETTVCILQKVLLSTNLSLVGEGIYLLKECQEILMDTTDLYSVQNRSNKEIFSKHVKKRTFPFARSYPSNLATFKNNTRNSYGNKNNHTFVGSLPLEEPLLITQKKNSTSSDLMTNANSITSTLTVSQIPSSFSMTSFEKLEIGINWEINILQLAKSHPHILLEVGVKLLSDKMDAINSTSLYLITYLRKLESCYHANPYHNKIHAASVAHATACLMTMLYIHKSSLHNPINDIAIIIAALGHDAGHPGRNNNFLVNSSNNMAIFYNDTFVLENAHSAITFKCLDAPGANIFANVPRKVFREIRKRIIELILITDMGHHFEAVSRFRLRQKALGFNYLCDPDDMWLVIRMCLKCADLGHTMVEWEQHFDWSLRVVEEFYQQGDHELQLGLKISPLCDRSCHVDFSKAQKSFIEFVVQPLMTQMEELEYGFGIKKACIERLMSNKLRWESLIAEKYVPEISEEYKNMKTDASLTIQILVSLYIEGKILVPLQK